MISTNYAATSARRSLAGGDLKPQWRRTGVARFLPTVDQIDRGLVLCIAGARESPAGQAGRAGVAGGDGRYDDGGGRSSGVERFDVAVH